MHRFSFRLALIVFAFVLAFSGTQLPSSHAALHTPTLTDPDVRARVADAYGQLSMHFEANQDQFDDRVDFLTRGSGYTLFLTGSEAVFSLRAPVESPPTRGLWPAPDALETDDAATYTTLRMQLVGGSPNPQVSGAERLPGIINYFIGNDPDQWVTDIPTYGAVDYLDVYPGIDLRYCGNQTELQYDFIVSPGADPSIIRLQFQHAESVELDTNGDLLLHLPGGVLRQHTPFTYQDVDGERVEVHSRFVLLDGGQVGFAVGTYDRSRPLVIDPELVYSTYLGGGSDDDSYAIAVDSSGAAYVTGWTESSDFPIQNSFQAANQGNGDAFVTKLNASGSALVYSTYLGGDSSEKGYSIAVDSSGAAYITGETASSDFPTQTPYQASNQGGYDAFVTKLPAPLVVTNTDDSGAGSLRQAILDATMPHQATT